MDADTKQTQSKSEKNKKKIKKQPKKLGKRTDPQESDYPAVGLKKKAKKLRKETVKGAMDEDDGGDTKFSANSTDYAENEDFEIQAKPDSKKRKLPAEVNKTTKSDKSPEKMQKLTDENSDQTETKLKSVEMPWKKRKEMRRKSKNKLYDIGLEAKKIWEELRRDDCSKVRKQELLKDLTNLVKGRVKELIFAHDTVRVIECMEALGSEFHRNFLFSELKDDIVALSKSKYAKFFIRKMLVYGTKEQKNHIMKSFHGHVVQLMTHAEAASVVECAYNEYANALQRYHIVQEFYGRDYALFKDNEVKTLPQILESDPKKRKPILDALRESLIKLAAKDIVNHSLIHHVMREFLQCAEAKDRSDLNEAMHDKVIKILHTKDGSRVAMNCIWHGTAKDRKVIIKSFKTHVAKIAKEEHGHMVLLAIFDCVDDTKLVKNIIISELLENIDELALDTYGHKVLAYLVNPRDSKMFPPGVVKILEEGDKNETSRKDKAVRQKELQEACEKHLVKVIIENVDQLLKTGSTVVFILSVLTADIADKGTAYQAIASELKEPYAPSKNDVYHLVEDKHSTFLFKKLILHDKTISDKEKTFSVAIAEVVPEEIMRSWIHCNRGLFLLVSLLETEIEIVKEKVVAAMNGLHKTLAKMSEKGATVLLSKLKAVNK